MSVAQVNTMSATKRAKVQEGSEILE